MSADPNTPTDPSRETGGYVVRNMIYRHTPQGSLEVMTGWNDASIREYNQEIVPPADTAMDPRHPCNDLNVALIKCSLECEPRSRLAYRVATCNDDRRAMMQCMTKNKQWVPPQRPWYKLW